LGRPESPDPIDVRDLPGTREVVACRDGGLFPVAVQTGGDVVAVVRGGAGHLGLAGRLEIIRSADGLEWSAPTVAADSERDDRNAALGVAGSGELLLAYQQQGSYDDAGVYRPERRDSSGAPAIAVVGARSADGLSWSQPRPLGIPALAAASPYGKIARLADGTLLLALYTSIDGERSSWIARSADDGRAWSDPSRIASEANETALLALPDGAVLAVMRSAGAGQELSGTRSFDGGGTWSAPRPITGAHQHPGDLVLLAGGEVLLTYGNRAPPYRIEGRLSRDGGATWDERRILFSAPLYGEVESARPTDFGYPSSVVTDGRGVTIYYLQPHVERTAAGPSHLRPPYPVAGYRAIAVSWREDELLGAFGSARP
jgi:hypothetical protein